MLQNEKMPLGKLIVKLGLIKEENLKRALTIQELTPDKKIGTILFEMGLIDKDTLLESVSHNLQIPTVDLKREEIDSSFVRLFPKELLFKHKVLPLRKTENKIILGMADPLDIIAQDDISLAGGLAVTPVLVWEDDVEKFLNIVFEAKEFMHRFGTKEIKVPLEFVTPIPENTPIKEIVHKLISLAYKLEATDFHLEPQRTNIRVRYRIDGVFYDFPNLPKEHQEELINEFKEIAGIGKDKEKNNKKIKLPTKGRIIGKFNDLEINLRIFTLPILYGEKVAVRLLNLRSSFLELEKLGLSKELFSELEDIIHKPNGFILISGPAGSGRSTTFYSILRHLITHQSSIFTIEDPIEHTIPNVNQVQLNPFCKFDFNQALQAVIDQMPDAVFVSRIMSPEIAQASFEVALSGRLVIGTTHAFDTASTFTRLLDFGIEPYLLCSCLLGIISQKLIRALCPNCKEIYKPASEELEKLGLENDSEVKLFKAVGCKQCFNTGYRGRIAIYEIFKIKEGTKDLILKKSQATIITKSAEQTGMITLKDEGIKKVKEGLTTFEELLRVVAF